MANNKKLRRSTDDRMIGGVAAGVAEYFDMDPTIVRVVWALLFVFGGFGLLVYLIMWIVVPEKEAGLTVVPDVAEDTGNPQPRVEPQAEEE